MGKYRNEHDLVCKWCNHENDIKNVQEMFEAFPNKLELHYTCDKCTRKSRLKVSVKGFYSMHPADKVRFIRNSKRGTARLITLSDLI